VRKLVRSAGPVADAATPPATCTPDLRSLPADWRDRRSSGHGTGALEPALVTRFRH